MKIITFASLLLLVSCASAPTNTQQTTNYSSEPSIWDYVKVFGELTGEMLLGLTSAIADNADTITGAVGSYSDARSNGANKGDAYQAASQAIQSSGTAGYSAPSRTINGSGANICNRDTSQLSLGEFKMCAIQDCRAQNKTPRETSPICVNCDGQWTRCYRSASSAS